MIRIYQFIIQWGHVGHQPQPAEGINLLILLQPVGRDAGATDAMIAVATGDEIASNRMLYAVVPVADGGALRVPVRQPNI